MKLEPVSVNAGQVMRGAVITVRIRGTRRLRFRVWLGAHVVRFGCWIMGCRGEVEHE
jgi:hypothetical protein